MSTFPGRRESFDDRLHAAASARVHLTRLIPAVAEHVQRARRAELFARAGRHAAAERLLRDVAGALARRAAWEPRAWVLIDLGRLLLVRGRAAEARRVFVEAREAAVQGGAVGPALDAGLWEVGALTDDAQLDEADSRARAIAGSGGLDASRRAWVDACLVRLDLWSGRETAAAERVPASEPHPDVAVAAWIESMAVRALLAGRCHFEAGSRAGAASRLSGLDASPHAQALVERARLRVRCEAGDLEGAASCLERVRRYALSARVPLEQVRAVLVWHGLLRRIGPSAQAQAVQRHLRRAAAACPPLLRLAIEREAAESGGDEPARRGRAAVRSSADPPLLPEIVGTSPALGELRRSIERAAAAPFAVLVEGESGVGKELVARAIHRLSPRASRRFCDVNCAALPDDLVEAELFGHARGAYTGAQGERPGLFEEASGGTLFLDEVSELSMRAQAKLLRVLQQQEVRRLGEAQSRPIDVRVVAASNRPMSDEAAAGRFRADLLYRLDVVRLYVPPLRERPEDVPALADRFWQAAAARVGSTATLSAGLVRALSAYEWPGNVRELQNVLAALAVAAPPRGQLSVSLLPARIGEPRVRAATLTAVRTACEREAVRAALGRAGGRRADAARELGLTRQGLLKAMHRLGLRDAPFHGSRRGGAA